MVLILILKKFIRECLQADTSYNKSKKTPEGVTAYVNSVLIMQESTYNIKYYISLNIFSYLT
jgi:hypothetical protein